jgi:hypothetical protein
MTKGKSEKKDDVITNDLINAVVSCIDAIRSKYSQTDAHEIHEVIKLLEPLLEPFRIKLIDEYFAVVAEIEKDKKRLSTAERRDYLTRLLAPLIKLNSLHPSGKNPYLERDGTYPFIEEKIWIDKEINIKALHYDEQKYSINFEYSKPLNLFDPDARNIIIWNEYREHVKKKKNKYTGAKKKGIKFRPITPIDEGCTSIRELYEKWLPTLTEDTIKSNDLLDKILVCFTLKRALNGDGQAIDKLYSLFEGAATGIAVNMAKKRRISRSSIEDIKQEAKICLRFLISGFKPEDIVDLLSKGKEVPLQIEKFYFWYYSNYVPKELDKIIKRPFNRLDRIEIDYFLNPIAPIDAYTLWQNTPKRIVKFNSDSFRPGGGIYYLATWLFGTKKNYMQGRFCQHISEKIDRCRNFLDANEDEEARQQVNATSEHPQQLINDASIEKAIDILCSKGVARRDAEIFIKNCLQGFSKTALAQEYSLSRRQNLQNYFPVLQKPLPENSL